jgi:sugar phosphate isomerase/epimerase
MPDRSRLSINLATLRKQWDLRRAVEGCARAGIGAVAPWRDQVAATGLQESARIIKGNGMRVSGLCRGGMFPGVDAADRQRRIDDNRRAIEEAATLGADCLVFVVGGLPTGSKDLPGARQMVLEGFAAIQEEAIAAGVPLALEPLHPMYCGDRAVLSTTRQALDICDKLGNRGMGVALDVYHIWWDPEIEAQIARAGKERILAFHICDWLVPTTDLLEDRGMMGDGVIDIPRLRRLVEAAGFAGCHEVEIFSRTWWQRDPEEVLRVCIARHQQC